MSQARDRILNKLKKNAIKPFSTEIMAAPIKQKITNPVELFTANLTLNHAEIINALPNTLNEQLTQYIDEHTEISSIVIDKKLDEMKLTLPASCQEAEFPSDFSTQKSVLFNDIDCGLTATKCAIAETGTLVIWSSTQCPRSISLIPPTHIAIVYVSQLYSTFAEMLATENWQHNMPTNALLISGPSKTADIQQTLAYGAHGPKNLTVFLVNDK